MYTAVWPIGVWSAEQADALEGCFDGTQDLW